MPGSVIVFVHGATPFNSIVITAQPAHQESVHLLNWRTKMGDDITIPSEYCDICGEKIEFDDYGLEHHCTDWRDDPKDEIERDRL